MFKNKTLATLAGCLALLAACLYWPSLAPAAHDKAKPRTAILLVTFGTSVPAAQTALEAIDRATRERFPGREVRWAYTSKKIRHKLAKAGQVKLSPAQALANLAEEGFDSVAVQSLHIIPGEEYEGLLETARRFTGLPKGLQKVEVGLPLLASHQDMLRTAQAMLAQAPAGRQASEALLFMGHGTPHPANAAYPAMAYVLQKLDPNTSLATVEGYPDLAQALGEMQARGNSKAWLIPLMSVAGDHAVNDMAGPEEDSWKSRLSQAGIQAEPVLRGMAEYPAIVAIWLDHLQAALDKLP